MAGVDRRNWSCSCPYLRWHALATFAKSTFGAAAAFKLATDSVDKHATSAERAAYPVARHCADVADNGTPDALHTLLMLASLQPWNGPTAKGLVPQTLNHPTFSCTGSKATL